MMTRRSLTARLSILVWARPASAAALCVLACSFAPATARAQSSLTGELTEARKLDVSFDFLGSAARRQAGGFEWYLPGVTFGVKDGLEVGGALSIMTPQTSDEPREIVTHARWRLFETSRQQSAILGTAWHIPVSLRDSAETYGLVHASFNQTVGSRRPVTLSAGMYALAGRNANQFDDTRWGVMLGWDQTLSSRWSFSVEWTSGDNWYGYVFPGVTFATDTQWITAGYCIGNRPAANHGPCISAGRTF